MVETKWDTLPVLDWDLAKRLAGNQVDLAQDMLSMLTRDLPNDISTITTLATEQNYPELLVRVHRLHGAVSYCGTPRLKSVLAHIETRLKNNLRDEIPGLIKQLNTESSDLIKASKSL